MKTLFALLLLIPSLSWAETKKEFFDDWFAEISIDDFSDEIQVGVSSTFTSSDKGQFIFFMKEDAKFMNIDGIYFVFDDYVCGQSNNSELVDVKYRIDKNEPIDEYFNLTTDNEAGLRWSNKKVVQKIINEMFDGETLIMRVFDDMCGKIIDYKFSLNGLREAHNFAVKNSGFKK